jgi:hypothetical protein
MSAGQQVCLLADLLTCKHDGEVGAAPRRPLLAPHFLRCYTSLAMSEPAREFKSIQEHFVHAVMPKVMRHAEVYFRKHRHDQDTLEELAQASVCIAWKWYLVLKLKGEKDPDAFVSVLATRACQAVKNGRTVSGQERFSSVHNRMTQYREGFVVGRLPEHEARSYDDELLRAMQDREAGPADLVACALDTAAWLSHLDERKRSMALDMMAGQSTSELADKYGITAGAISQMRRKLVEDYTRFVGTEHDLGR